jgi:hypothetical protein
MNTLRDILKARGEEPEIIITVAKKPALSPAEAEKIEKIIGNMSNHEKAVAVHSIPTEILQNEITRRVQRDKEVIKQIKSIVDALERY